MFGSNKKPLITNEKILYDAFDRRKGDLGRRLQDKSFSDQDTGVFPSVAEAVKILGNRRCRIYLGIDPTGPDIHLGHTIPLLFLKQLLKFGHIPVLVIGDFTARIGDPTGKESARKPLTPQEVKDNMKNYLEQVYKILSKDSFEVKYNSSWLSKMTLEGVVKLASHVTVQQMITRDMFQERIKNEKPIGVHEFLYPLMQGYDSVFMKVDGEVGGNDQTFNMLVGRDLEKKLINKDKLVFTTQLLVDAISGKKMSKSEGGFISLSDAPEEMFGKVMAIPDGFIRGMFKLCTERDMDWVDEHDEDIKNRPFDYKKELAIELVSMYHGEKEAKKAKEEWEKVFSKKELPTEIPEYPGAGELVTQWAVGAQLAPSQSEIKRLIEQHAVKINGEVITDWKVLKSGDIVQIGPRKFAKVK